MGWFALPQYDSTRLSYDRVASTRFLAANGHVLFERRSSLGGFNTPVSLDQISPFVIEATLASEDANFRSHFGVDPVGVARAAWLNVKDGGLRYGGSTLTQQLAKMLDREPRTLVGKFHEAIAALRIEKTLTKDEILTQYLNRAYYGRNAYGIEAAARRFFGVSAHDLTLDQATLLATLPRAPSAYAPDRFPERAFERRAHVLELMVQRGFLSAKRAEETSRTAIALAPRQGQHPQAPHLVDRLLQRVETTGEVRTSIDLGLQTQLERHLDTHLNRVREYGARQGAVVVLDNGTASVIALVGSRDYQDAQELGAVNGVLSRRPAGSTLKPFVYALAFEQGLSRRTEILDQPSTFPGYQPRNTQALHVGWVPLEQALGSSLNLPAVTLLEHVGLASGARRIHDLGFASVDPTGAQHGLALALGAAPVSLLELAGAYATLANGGVFRAPALTQGDALSRRVFSTDAASEVTRVLMDAKARAAEFGPETPLDFPFPVAAKTGTSAAFCDNWTIGYTREVTVAVWVGNFDGKPLRGALAMTGAAPLFHDAMFEAMRNRKSSPLVSSVAREASSKVLRVGQGRALRVASPPPGSTYLIDPLLPRERQRVQLRLDTSGVDATNPAARLEWRVDGTAIAIAGIADTSSVALEPGDHRVAVHLIDEHGQRLGTAESHFNVTSMEEN